MRDTKDSENVSFLKELFFEAGKPSLEHFGLTEITDIKKEHVHKKSLKICCSKESVGVLMLRSIVNI